jgi:hypothetical protein
MVALWRRLIIARLVLRKEQESAFPSFAIRKLHFTICLHFNGLVIDLFLIKIINSKRHWLISERLRLQFRH